MLARGDDNPRWCTEPRTVLTNAPVRFPHAGAVALPLGLLDSALDSVLLLASSSGAVVHAGVF